MTLSMCFMDGRTETQRLMVLQLSRWDPLLLEGVRVCGGGRVECPVRFLQRAGREGGPHSRSEGAQGQSGAVLRSLEGAFNTRNHRWGSLWRVCEALERPFQMRWTRALKAGNKVWTRVHRPVVSEQCMCGGRDGVEM